jgi:D-beta-D-heptose 7-phosphate kinase/D-beta-D-heptose 1-phosphate adenosyltransferase
MRDAAHFANRAAGVVVAKLGTASVTPAELQSAAAVPRLNTGQDVMSESELASALADLRSAGKRVVMTNGCFDLIHPGHIRYLRQAAALGDVLVVAVNDDDSVRRLKGASRPLNTVSDRMAVLAGLEAIDFVVPFSEDTPERVIEVLAPDVLVKGGDYSIEQIAGHESVLQRGGEVRILDFFAGHSTTGLIERLQD